MEKGITGKRKSPEPQTNVVDNSNKELEMYQLEKKISNGIMQLKQLNEEINERENDHVQSQPSDEGGRRKMMGRVVESILKKMLKLVDECNVEGFVYGIIPDKGKPISAASENLRLWWQEKVKFDHNGPHAIRKYKEANVEDANKEDSNLNKDNYASLRTLHELSDTTLIRKKTTTNYCDVARNDVLINQEGNYDPLHNANLVQTEANIQRNSGVIRPIALKRTMPMGTQVYTCDSSQCPYYIYDNGFPDKDMRDYHQVNCPYRT